jgi:NADH-quinone oxidoreductase subunit C
MDDLLLSAVAALEERFATHPSEFRDQVSLSLERDQIVEACRTLRDEYGFELLSDETAVDYWPEETPRFHVIYQLTSLRHNLRISLRVPISGLDPSLPTIEGIYPNANWHEREIWDMFGIRFEGHSDLRRLLMPADWEGHPLRKDYPLGYEEVQFTFNLKEVNDDKTYAQE